MISIASTNTLLFPITRCYFDFVIFHIDILYQIPALVKDFRQKNICTQKEEYYHILLYNTNMKEKYRFFSIRFNQAEWDMMQTLKKKHGINLSATVKIILKEKLDKLENEQSIK